MSISKKIEELRTEANMTQEELANKLNISPQAVSNWERGENLPALQNLKLLSKHFSVSVDELVKSDEQLESELKIKKQKKTQNLISFTAMLVSGIILLAFSLFMYLKNDTVSWFTLIVGLFLVIDGSFLVKKYFYQD